MMQSSSEPMKKMIVNRRDCIQIEAKQVLFWFKCSYKLVRNFTLVVCCAQYNQRGFYNFFASTVHFLIYRFWKLENDNT